MNVRLTNLQLLLAEKRNVLSTALTSLIIIQSQESNSTLPAQHKPHPTPWPVESRVSRIEIPIFMFPPYTFQTLFRHLHLGSLL